MEEKSLDQLRQKAQEVYQAKLRAYQELQKETATEIQKPKTPAQNITIDQSSSTTAPLPKNILTNIASTESLNHPKKNNWFVVSVFLVMLTIVLIELFLFSPGKSI